MLHGYLSCKESFFYQIKYLSRNFKVTAPDILGFGASARIERPYSVRDYCDWLEEFMRGAKLERPHIICHSFGARVAIRLISERPELCEKLIITGGAGIVKPRSPEYLRRVRAYRRVKKIFPKFAEKHFGSEEYRSLTPLMKESFKKIVNEDLSAYAAKISNPTLLVYGRDDTVTPFNEEGVIFNKLISGSRLELIDGGHFCFSDNPEIFNRLVYSFLKG